MGHISSTFSLHFHLLQGEKSFSSNCSKHTEAQFWWDTDSEENTESHIDLFLFILAFQSSQHSHYWKLYPQTLCSENISNTYCCLWNNYTSKHLCSMLCFPRYCSSLNKQRYPQCPTGTISQVYPSKVVENKRTRWVKLAHQDNQERDENSNVEDTSIKLQTKKKEILLCMRMEL